MRFGLIVLAALAAGIASGAWIRALGPGPLNDAAHGVAVVGSVWLDALRMTLAPLIFALVVDAVLKVAEQAAAGALARRVLVSFAVLLVVACAWVLGAGSLVLQLLPVDVASAAALTASAASDPGAEVVAAAPVDMAAWVRSLIPTNVIAAAAENKIVPLVLFAVILGAAIARLEPVRRAPLRELFGSLAEAMIVVVGWVLLLAPVGVFALALSLGLDTGFEAVGALGHYVLFVVSMLVGVIVIATLVLLAFARLAPVATLRALVPVQAIAASTQSSLATLPAMLQTALGPLRVSPAVAEFTLPLAVAVFRMTSPVGNLAVALFVAHIAGVELSAADMLAGALVAIIVSISSVGLPGQSSFVISVAPICVAMGIPVTVLPLLLAVEVLPDIFRTIGNVTADLAVTAVADRQKGQERQSETGSAP